MQTLESWIFDHVILRDEAHKIQFSYRKEDTITIVPIGANLGFFHDQKSSIREKFRIDPEMFLFTYAGSLNPVRKIETLIDSLKCVLAQEKAVLMIIGNGGTERLREYAQVNHMEDHVIFTGEIPYDQVPVYLAAADCFISYVPITPEFDIQPPLKTVEALATGLPVIATDTLGNRRFICHGENGVLTGDDASSMSSAMLLMMHNDSLREKVQKNARKSVEGHDWKKIVSQKLLPAYERILA